MRRLRDLGLQIGSWPTGPLNAVTDVAGVRAGHAPGAVSGISIVVPYADAPRRYYAGRWSLDGGDETTGLAMLEDFGTLSTPLALAPAPAIGRVYDGLLDYGFSRDAGLGEDSGWPPAVLALEGVPVPAVSLHAALGAGQVAAALSTATNGPVAEGQVGVGTSLAAFGVRAGIGTSSRVLSGGTVGVLLAANGGEPVRLAVNGTPVGRWLKELQALAPSRRRSFAAVVLTDMPLLPMQLDRLAQRASFGLVRVGLLDEHTASGTVIAVSTTGLDDSLEGMAPGTVAARPRPEADLPELFAAAADVCQEAVLNALVVAHAQSSADGSMGLPVEAFASAAAR